MLITRPDLPIQNGTIFKLAFMPGYALPSLINLKLMNQSGSTLGRQAVADQEISVVPVQTTCT